MNKIERILRGTLLAAPLLAGAGSSAADPPAAAPAHRHFAIQADAVPWSEPPEGMVSGKPSVEGGGELKFAVLEGDPMKPGRPYSVRISCSDGYKVAPHWHPTAENVVVVTGAFLLATGDAFDAKKLDASHEIKTGGYAYMPARMHHFGQCKGLTDVVVYGVGPFKINFLAAPAAGAKKP